MAKQRVLAKIKTATKSNYRGRKVGTFGDLATLSFYPAHHITMGEGGAVITNMPCWCEPGLDNTCGKRFSWELGTLPCGYDHKYTYSHIGYNLKATDMQAALGLSQLDKLEQFIKVRRENFRYLRQALEPLQDVLMLPVPTDFEPPVRAPSNECALCGPDASGDCGYQCGDTADLPPVADFRRNRVFTHQHRLFWSCCFGCNSA
jgi:hypothetical protein